MEARINRHALRAAATQALFAAAVLWVSMGAGARSTNFIVDAADPNFAQQMAKAAEQYRHDLAIAWLGQPLPNWAQPCIVTVQAGPQLGAGGATSFKFDRGEVYDWVMSIQGSHERLIDSVLPHEVTHTIFASHFRQPLPRWADEGERHERRARQREEQALADAQRVSPHRSRHPLQSDVRHDRVPARHHAAVRPGLLVGRVLDPNRRTAEIRGVSPRRHGPRRLVGGRRAPLRHPRPERVAKHVARLGEPRFAGDHAAQRSADSRPRRPSSRHATTAPAAELDLPRP